MASQDPRFLVLLVVGQKLIEGLDGRLVFTVVDADFGTSHQVASGGLVLDVVQGNLARSINLSLNQKVNQLKKHKI